MSFEQREAVFMEEEMLSGAGGSGGEDAAGAEDLRRGPWTVEEDMKLANYIAAHGEGRWNALARCAGLRRTGKSCRLRWLNYLRPDLRRGNITPQEQLLILELHSRWGNRWSKIAQRLPGRTDNEIKNYWRTRVQKHAKQLKCDVNSQRFKDIMRHLWMPQLAERIAAAAAATAAGTAQDSIGAAAVPQIDHWAAVDQYYSTQSPELGSSSSSESAQCFWSPPAATAADESSYITPSHQQFGDQYSANCWTSVDDSGDQYYLDGAGAGFPEFDIAAWSDNLWGSADELLWS